MNAQPGTPPRESVRLVSRRDVRLVNRAGHVYICSSTGTLRVPQRNPELSELEGDIGLEFLPDDVIAGLRSRTLVHSASDAPLSHPLYDTGGPDATRPAVVVGEGPLSDGVAERLRRAGAEAVRAPAPDRSADPGALVLPLHGDEVLLRRWTERAMDARAPILTHLSSPARLLFALLDPPRTACPVCLVRRLRANHTWQPIADLPLDVLYGAAESDRWPTTAIAAAMLAHQTMAALTRGPSGPAELLEVDHATLVTTRHPALHTPLCPACAPVAAPPEPAEPPAVDPESCWERMRRAVDPLTGLVAEVRVRDADREPGNSTTHVLTAGHPTTTWFSPVQASSCSGAVKYDPTLARVCAVGEFMERYAAGVYDPDRLVRASFRKLGAAAVDPRSLPLASEREYAALPRIAPFDPDLELDWVEGRSLTTGRSRYVPACVVYVPYRFPRRRERLIDPISTGLAAGSGPHHATLGGLLEVVERDAVAVFWENRLALPTLDLGGLTGGPAAAIVERLTAAGVQVLCKDLTTDLGIPAVSVRYVEGPADRPVVAHATSAHLDLHGALLGALEEADLCRTGLRSWLAERDIPGVDDIELDRSDFYTYYCGPGRLSLVPFWDEGPLRPLPAPSPAPASHQAAVEEVVRRLAARGYEPIAVDITPVDVAECGVRVVRSVVPGLCPITLRRDFRRRGGRRLYEAPVRMGLRAAPLTEDELNPYPLPLG
ncbi:TOMM precursor leader peptide-binding protein [Streptomyces sparsogenes]|uniref:TOMM precursor leader peptide-binding protein n=1 Tax=Streptomyces sparsogenes TaxID=67365 RepID=UPI0033FFA8FD